MPQLTFRGFAPPLIEEVAPHLAAKLADVLDCPEDYFTFDCISVLSFSGGHSVPTEPFIEILWFDRGQPVQDEAAAVITQIFTEIGINELEICFKAVSPSEYYRNGIHYGQK